MQSGQRSDDSRRDVLVPPPPGEWSDVITELLDALHNCGGFVKSENRARRGTAATWRASRSTWTTSSISV